MIFTILPIHARSEKSTLENAIKRSIYNIILLNVHSSKKKMFANKGKSKHWREREKEKKRNTAVVVEEVLAQSKFHEKKKEI